MNFQKIARQVWYYLVYLLGKDMAIAVLKATNQYSAALHYYLQAGAVCSDFFNKMVPPDVYTDQVSYNGI
ncbi:integrator complex subunit 8 [Limosa lapponica baueri]|uniref:Integrator complex subunit 8 n=1 Tax=Limosa lapponica baueri TaxID=1758121 RepID=A0A2I0T0Y6_LIMLA|nr:integrator complex subunit 8 [Limosa lapponica baueri]